MNSEVVKAWIEDNSPLGTEKLAVQAGVSYTLIKRILKGHIPTSLAARRGLCTALQVEDSKLFPVRK